MPSNYAALCNDFYVNQRLNLKMDLPMRRDTILGLFDRIRREQPQMDRFRRYQNELALESRGGGAGAGYQWLAVRKTSVRSGSVNPEEESDAYALHRSILETAPYFLDISPLDMDHLEVLFGFDLLAAGNHDSITFNALMSDSPLAALADGRDTTPVDCQPLFGVALTDELDLQAHFEIKTRTSARQVRTGEYREEPISIYLIVRKYGPFGDVKDLPEVFMHLVEKGVDLLDTKVVPNLLMPIRESIASGG